MATNIVSTLITQGHNVFEVQLTSINTELEHGGIPNATKHDRNATLCTCIKNGFQCLISLISTDGALISIRQPLGTSSSTHPPFSVQCPCASVHGGPGIAAHTQSRRVVDATICHAWP